MSGLLTRVSANLIIRNNNLAGSAFLCVCNRMVQNADTTCNLDKKGKMRGHCNVHQKLLHIILVDEMNDE